jgi:hypothetical protein
MVVISSDRRGKLKLAQPGNREWVTVIQGINSQDWTVPLFIVVKGKYHFFFWYENDALPKDWRIAVSANGWTTNELTANWLKYFNKYTRNRKWGAYRLFILNGYKSYYSDAFEQYCKKNNIITFYMLAHFSHIFQLLNMAYFAPLKKAYGTQIEKLVRARISHIIKKDFFPAFCDAFKKNLTESNIRASFQKAGLVPLNPDIVITKLDVKLQTLTFFRPPSRENLPRISRILNNLTEAISQFKFIKSRIARH